MSMIRSGAVYLNIDPVPSMREALAFIQNEKRRRGVFDPQSKRHSQPTHRDSNPCGGSDDKDKLHCYYC